MDTNQPNRPAGLPPSMRQPASARPQVRHSPSPPPPSQPVHHQHASAPEPKKRKVGFWVLVAVLGLIVLGLGWFIFRIATGNYNEFAVKPNQYQAVFLNNNMVYFGKISNVDGSYVKLTNNYYLQVQGQQGQQQAQQEQGQQPQVSLAKLGNELHGPEDTMYIDRKSILFWENLQANGRVVQAIKDYQSKNGIK